MLFLDEVLMHILVREFFVMLKQVIDGQNILSDCGVDTSFNGA